MAITLTAEPPTTTDFDDPATPVPVSDCLRWCMQPDAADGITTGGTFAEMEVTFLSTIVSIPADGTEFTIWGHTFEVDSTVTGHTATKIQINALGSITGRNFRDMLKSNVFFAENTTVVPNPDFFALRSTKITWNECGQKENFSGAAMDLSGLSGIIDGGAPNTVTNGTEPEYVPGYMLRFRLLKYDTASGAHVPIGKFRGIEPRFDCDDIQEECVNLMRDAARLVHTPMPDLAIDSEIDPDLDTIIGRFVFNYGWTFRDDNCQPQSGDLAETGDVMVINSAFALEEKYGIAPYWILSPDFVDTGLDEQKFLTCQPRFHFLSERSFAWLWFLNPFGTLYDGLAVDHFDLEIVATDVSGSSFGAIIEYPAMETWKCFNFNVSPARVADLTAIDISELVRYEVNLRAFDAGETDFRLVSELLKYEMDRSCNSLTDTYFLMPQGGIGTLIMDIDERSVFQEGVEICLDTDCAETRLDLAKYGGRMLTNIRSYEKVVLRSRQSYGEDILRYFRAFKASPERWIQVRDTTFDSSDVTYTAKRLLIATGGVKIFQSGEWVELVVEGIMGDIPVQTPRNLS